MSGQKPRLVTVDVRALAHILKHAEKYQKPEPLRYHLSKILGAGVSQCFFLPPPFRLKTVPPLGLLLVEGRLTSEPPNSRRRN